MVEATAPQRRRRAHPEIAVRGGTVDKVERKRAGLVDSSGRRRHVIARERFDFGGKGSLRRCQFEIHWRVGRL